MKSMFKSTLLLGLTTAMAVSSAMGALTFTNGDLILGFQATGGTGVATNVFYNLGRGVDARDGVTSGTIGNINTTLETVYGAGWYNRSDLYFGVIGNLNQNAPIGEGPPVSQRPVINGDPSRTYYLSTATSSPGDGLLIGAGTYPSASLGQATLSSLEGILGSTTSTGDGAATYAAGSPNSWTQWNPILGAAFNVFGGIQQNFGKVTDSTYVDLQRVLAVNNAQNVADPTGTVGGGDYMLTFAISNTGDISVVPEPSAALLGSLGALALFRRRRA